MAESKYTLERVIQVWDDKSGDRVEFGPDGDSLGLYEVRHVDSTGKKQNIVTLEREQAILLFRSALEELEKCDP